MASSEFASLDFEPACILDSLNDGLYVCDCERRIVYWSKAAERITGWPAADIKGKRCCDNVLNHTDKDDNPLCGEESCPLHRAILTGENSTCPIVVFAQGQDGGRIPMQVSVAPIRNSRNEIVGGVETFRDLSHLLLDLERARMIQGAALAGKMPDDPRLRIAIHYAPFDLIGGDFYAIETVDRDRYGILLADVMGHGMAAALYTMHLRALLDEFRGLLDEPAKFLRSVSMKLCQLVGGDKSFAAGLFALIDLRERSIALSGAGFPMPLIGRADGSIEQLRCSGPPLGFWEAAEFKADLGVGDSLLFYSDGAIELFDLNGAMVGIEGLIAILGRTGMPGTLEALRSLETELLKRSNEIRFGDDLTLMAVRIEA